MDWQIPVFIALGVAFVGVLLVYTNRRTTRLYQQALGAFEGGELLKVGPFVTRIRGRWRGREAQLWKSEGSDKSPSHLHASLAGAGGLRMTLRPESASHKFVKKLGWTGIEIEVGDQEVDDLLLIQTDDEQEARRILTHPDVRVLIEQLLSERFHYIDLKDGTLEVRRTNYEESDFEQTSVRSLYDGLSLLLDVAEGVDRGAAPAMRTARAEAREAAAEPQLWGLPEERSASAHQTPPVPPALPASGGGPPFAPGTDPARHMQNAPLHPQGAGRGPVVLIVGIVLILLAAAAWYWLF
jgi:hypothetical protein